MFDALRNLFKNPVVKPQKGRRVKSAVSRDSLLTGDSPTAPIPIRHENLPNVAIIAEREDYARIYVTNEFRYEAEFGSVIRHLEALGFNYGIEISSASEIRTKYPGSFKSEVVSSNNTANDTLFDSLLARAINLNASDLRFHVRSTHTAISFKIDGETRVVDKYDSNLAESICAHLYNIASDEKAHENEKLSFAPEVNDQSSVIEREINGRMYRLRYQSLPEAYGGFDVSLRILPMAMDGVIPTLESLGLPPSAVKMLRKAAARRKGMVFSVGPVGQGKTTTLYALLSANISDNPDLYRTTIEDPVEYRLKGATQIQVGVVGYENAMKALLRMGADEALVGEIRDDKMGELAFQADMTGTKVFTTTHTNSAHSTIPRLCDAAIKLDRQFVCDPERIAAMFLQRLLPSLCKHCRVPATTTLLGDYYVTQFQRLEIPLEGVYMRNKTGCGNCNKGVKGRIPVLEAIIPDQEYMMLMAKSLDAEAKAYWHSLCTSHVTEEDITGKPILANALYQMTQGHLDIEDIVKNIDVLESYEPAKKWADLQKDRSLSSKAPILGVAA